MDQAEPAQGSILIVEDIAELRRLARRQLQSLGFPVVEAADAAAALAILEGPERIALLFTDLILPGTMTGQDLARAARRLRPGLRVLFTSGFAEGRVRQEMDGARLLAKPYRREQLTELVREALADLPHTAAVESGPVGDAPGQRTLFELIRA